MRRLAALLLSLSLLLLVAPEPVHADARAEARRLYRRGMELIRQGDHEAGVDYLLRAYDVLPHPNVLYNVARAYAENGEYRASLEFFERYLETDPPDREQVEGFMASMHEILQTRERRQAEAAAAAAAVEQSVAERSVAIREAPPGAVPEQVEAVEEAARRLRDIAEIVGAPADDELTRRLAALAETLRRPPAPLVASAAPAAVEPGRAEAAVAATPEEETEPELSLVEDRQEEVYEEQVVSASRFAETSVTAPNATGVVTAQDIRLSGITNLGELLRRVPGVEVMTLSPGDTQVSIRGLNQRLSNKVLVLIDGRSVYLDFLGATVWHNLPVAAEDVERIETIRGPASAVYGADAFNGVVNIITVPPLRGRPFFSVGVGNGDTVRVAGSASARVDRVSYRVAAGMERADNYTLEIDRDRVDYDVLEESPEQGLQHVWARADGAARLGRGFSLDFGSGVSRADLSMYAVSRLQQTKVENFWFSQTYLDLTMPEGLRLRTFWNYHESDITRLEHPVGDPVFTSFVRTNVIDTEASWSHQLHLGVDHNLVIGTGYRLKTVEWDWLDMNHRQHHFALFFHDTMDLLERLQAVVSVRADRHPLLGGPQISPRGAVLIRPTERSAIRATAGAAFRSPTFLESYLETPFKAVPVHAVTTLSRGSTELDAERIVSFELGYENQDSDYFAFETSAYFNVLDDAIFLSEVTPYTLADFGSGEVGYIDDQEAFPAAQLAFANEDATFVQTGLETGLRVFPMSGLDVHVSYTLHDTSPLANVDLAGREEDQRTSRHKVNLGVQYRSDFGVDVAADLHWVDDQVWVLQVTDLEEGGISFAPFDVPAYALVNARLGYRFLDDRLDIGVVGTNLVAPGHREHPYGQPVERRIVGTLRGRL